MATAKKADEKTTDEETTEEKPATKRTRKSSGKLETSVEEPRIGQPFNVSWEAEDAISLRQAGPDGNYVWNVTSEGAQPVAATVIGTYTFSLLDGSGEAIAALAVTVKA